MAFSTEQLSTFTKHIDNILANSDLKTVSVKKVRTTLQDIIGDEVQLSGQLKPHINELIQGRFFVAEELAGVHEEADEEERPVKKRKTSTVKDEVKDEDGDDDEDSKLAAMLQAEENRSSRATRGARTARAAAPKKKAVVKRKKKEKVESEPEYDSEGNEIKKVKKGAFHKEYLLSEPLGVLVGGETQVSFQPCSDLRAQLIWYSFRDLNASRRYGSTSKPTTSRSQPINARSSVTRRCTLCLRWIGCTCSP